MSRTERLKTTDEIHASVIPLSSSSENNQMPLYFQVVAVVVSLASVLLATDAAGNSYPIVLVHGFSGWGRDELLGFKYWGGLQGDFQQELEAQGFTVYTAVVGPFSSNWDRACELYAQIKGGRVDYGETHSTHYGHHRYGRNFTGLYPQWGETNADGSINKVHLVGHSMGGQTIRMLTQMLEKGTTGAPVEETASIHPLFKGGNSWVHSITTVSTPNQGTLLADGTATMGNTLEDLTLGLLNVIGIAGNEPNLFYDAKLDQWGITAKTRRETLVEYLHRVFNSSIFEPGSRDISAWSLSTKGAAEENKWVTTLPDVYYYSFAAVDTFSTRDWLLRKISMPNVLTMMLPLCVSSTFLGSRFGPEHGLTTDWQPNDGVVNTVSMASDSTGQVVPFKGVSYIGKWNQMPLLKFTDHIAIVGITLLARMIGLYSAHAKLLQSLSVTPQSQAVHTEATVDINTSISSVTAATANAQTQENVQMLCDSSSSNKYVDAYCNHVRTEATQVMRH